MRQFIAALRDIWCAVTGRCRVEIDGDPYIAWMEDVKKEAIASQRQSRQRQRRLNIVEQQYLKGRTRP